MHAAPTVEYPVEPQAIVDRLWRGVWAASMLFFLVVAALYMPVTDVWRPALGVLVAGLCLALALRLRRVEIATRGVLRWDGLAWWYVDGRGALVQGSVRSLLDLQSLLLLRFEPVEGGGGKWLWLAGNQQLVLWPLLRRAVVAHGSVTGPVQAGAS